MYRETIKMLCSLELWRMAVLWTTSLIYSYLLLLLSDPISFFRRPRSTPSFSVRRLPGGQKPVCIITGATSGLGKAAAKSLAEKGYRVVLAARSTHLLKKTVGEIVEQFKDADVEAIVVDLSSTRSIMKFKTDLEQWLLTAPNSHFSVQLLINNAGILAASHRLTSDGYDEMMKTNYLGAFCLTNFILPLLKNSPVPSRIINVTSFTHRCVSFAQVNENDLFKNMYELSSSLLSKRYPFAHVYENSKFYLLMFTYELHRRLCMIKSSNKISAIAADPGVVETRIMRELPQSLSWLALKTLKHLKLLQNTENGVGAIVYAALAPPEVSGVYFFGGQGRTIKSSAVSYNRKLSEELWSSSWKLLSQSDSPLESFLKRCWGEGGS